MALSASLPSNRSAGNPLSRDNLLTLCSAPQPPRL